MPVRVHLFFFGFVCVVVSPVIAAPPALTPPEMEQVASGTMDFSPIVDDAGFYPLLRNALAWEAGDEAGAQIPDYNALLSVPAGHRGELCLIEGRLVAAPVRVLSLSRPGPWSDRLEQWTIQWGRKPGDVAVVYLVAPDSETFRGGRGRQGQTVRLVARFFKVWRTGDQLTGQTSDFLVFVGRDARPASGLALPVGDGDESTGLGAGEIGTVIALCVLAMLALGFFALKRSLGHGPLQSQQRLRRRREETAKHADETETPSPPLPGDPADALAALEHRHEQEPPSP